MTAFHRARHELYARFPAEAAAYESEYAALAARLAEAEALLREARDDVADALGRQSKRHRVAAYTEQLARIDAFLAPDADQPEAVVRPDPTYRGVRFCDLSSEDKERVNLGILEEDR